MSRAGDVGRPDVVVVGAGHNGLICAAYLARAGLRVTVLEARSEVGGCASTVDAIGARVNICGCDHALFRTTPVMAELGLAGHGLEYLDSDPWSVSVGWDPASTPWFAFSDERRMLDALGLTHPAQAGGYARYLRAARPAAELVLELANQVPTPGAVLAKVLERRGRGAATLLAWSRRSAAEVLRSFFSTDELVGPACVTGPAVWGRPPEAAGTGLGALSYAMRHLAPGGVPRGGSGMLPTALRAAFEAAGGTVRTDAPVTSVLAEGGRVRGVLIGADEQLETAAVVVTCDARTAIVSWLSEVPASARAMVDRWRAAPAGEGRASKLDLVVEGDLLRHPAAATVAGQVGVAEPAVPSTVVYPDVAGLTSNHHTAGQGRVAERPALLIDMPSALDPAFRPDGVNVVSLEVLGTPYALSGGWERSTEPERWLSLLDEVYGPGTATRVRDFRVVTPPEYEREFGLVGGKTPAFPRAPLAAVRADERSRYRTSVRGLYLAGADTYPGAGIWGAPGRNAAGVVLAQHGLRIR